MSYRDTMCVIQGQYVCHIGTICVCQYHLMPCSCGSIINGQREHCVMMAPFSSDALSAASPSFFHLENSESLDNTMSGLTPYKGYKGYEGYEGYEGYMRVI